jgi:hypothetical protein
MYIQGGQGKMANLCGNSLSIHSIEGTFMKLFSQLVKKDTVGLYCSACDKIRDMAYIESANHEMQFRCAKCKRPVNYRIKDTVQKESDVEGEYKMKETFKIGQMLYHTVFKEKGCVVGKQESCIYVNFDKLGLKKLVINYEG